MIIIQPSASRTTKPRAPAPSSKLLGYYHSSALRTDTLLFGQNSCRALRGALKIIGRINPGLTRGATSLPPPSVAR
jgi:hypothetical protein